jgi:uncharacterized protein YutE (UPF0331/DUF86 family)
MDREVIERKLTDRMKKAVGFRNIAVHSYEAINWHIVHSIASRHLVDCSEFAKTVSLKCIQSSRPDGK